MKSYILSMLFFLPFLLFSQESFDDNNENFSCESQFISENKTLSKKIRTSEMYIMGKKDARKHYDNYSMFTATFTSSLVMPPAGLATALTLTAIPPKQENFMIPEDKKDLLLNQEYLNGYRNAAHKKKILRSWAGFATGSAFFIAGFYMAGFTISDIIK